MKLLGLGAGDVSGKSRCIICFLTWLFDFLQTPFLCDTLAVAVPNAGASSSYARVHKISGRSSGLDL